MIYHQTNYHAFNHIKNNNHNNTIKFKSPPSIVHVSSKAVHQINSVKRKFERDEMESQNKTQRHFHHHTQQQHVSTPHYHHIQAHNDAQYIQKHGRSQMYCVHSRFTSCQTPAFMLVYYSHHVVYTSHTPWRE